MMILILSIVQSGDVVVPVSGIANVVSSSINTFTGGVVALDSGSGSGSVKCSYFVSYFVSHLTAGVKNIQ